MYLHIGNSQIVFTRELIGIFDYQLIAQNNWVKLDHGQGELRFTGNINKEKPKSLVLTDQETILSPISPVTLSKRQKTGVQLKPDF